MAEDTVIDPASIMNSQVCALAMDNCLCNPNRPKPIDWCMTDPECNAVIRPIKIKPEAEAGPIAGIVVGVFVLIVGAGAGAMLFYELSQEDKEDMSDEEGGKKEEEVVVAAEVAAEVCVVSLF